MNRLTTYEITIAQQLEQITVPDMREAIWDRIEAALDADDDSDPNDGGGSTPPPTNPPALLISGSILLLLVAGYLLYFFSTTPSNNSSIPAKTKIEKASPAPSPAPSPGQRPKPATNHNNPLLPAPTTRSTSEDLQPTQQESNGLSNFLQNSNTSKVVNDSLYSLVPPTKPPVTSPSITEKKQDSIPPKKQRGVKDLSENDYRIVPKKDSTP